MSMKRQAEEALKVWVASSRRKPLVLRGARQVGKSTLVRQTAQALGLPLWEVNLERYPALAGAFQTLDVSQILLELGLVLRRPVGQEPGYAGSLGAPGRRSAIGRKRRFRAQQG